MTLRCTKGFTAADGTAYLPGDVIDQRHETQALAFELARSTESRSARYSHIDLDPDDLDAYPIG